MKKRLMSVVIASLLIVSMCVPVSAKRVFIKTSPNGAGFWGEIPDDNNDSSSSDSNKKSSSSSSNSGAGQVKEPVYTTPTGQPITDSLLALLAASMDSTGATVPVGKTTIIAYSNYLKALGMRSALVTAFVPTQNTGKKAVKSTITNALIAQGLSYTVMVQRPTGAVEFIAPSKVVNGSLTYAKPTGPIASVAVVCNAVAPK